MPHICLRSGAWYLFVFVSLSMLALACADDKAAKRQVFTQDDTAIEEAREVEIIYSDSAVVRVRVTGPVLYNFVDRDNPHQEFPEGIHIDFLNPDLSIQSTLDAKKADRFNEKGKIIVRDSVVMNTAKHEKLETEELTWDEKTGKIHTDKFVKVTQPGEIIYGYGLEAEQDFSYWKILVPKGRIKVDQLNDVLK